MGPIELNKRIHTLDYLRGFALLGIILVNVLALLNINTPTADSIDASYQRFLYLFVEARFYSIFSFLFGVGFYIFITRAIAKGKNGYVLFLRRIAALLVFGIVHMLYHPGEALTLYAVCGLIILPFYKVKKEINLALAVIGLIALGCIAFKLLLPLPLILLGLAVGQYRVFENIEEKKTQIALFTMTTCLLSTIGLWYQYMNVPTMPFSPVILGGVDEPNLVQANKFMEIGIMTGPILSALYIGLLTLLLQSPIIQTVLAPLKYYGRMALTNYVFQTVLILLAGHAFHLFERITYIQSLFLCLGIFIIQLIFSVIWLRFFRLGPLEWVWRMVTYWEIPSLLKKRTAPDK